MQLCKNLLIADKSASVVRSPRLAAMGVATLSGLMLHFLEQSTTPTITEPRIKLANDAVTKLLAQRSVAWWMLNSPSSIHPIITAANAAKAPTTVAWTFKQNVPVSIHVGYCTLGDFRFEYEYEIEYDFSILVCRLHIITTQTQFIPWASLST